MAFVNTFTKVNAIVNAYVGDTKYKKVKTVQELFKDEHLHIPFLATCIINRSMVWSDQDIFMLTKNGKDVLLERILMVISNPLQPREIIPRLEVAAIIIIIIITRRRELEARFPLTARKAKS